MSQAELLSPASLSPSVSIHSGRPATTSLEVAKFFGKRHDSVLRDIDALLSQLPENSLQHNFEETYQEQETPFGAKRIRMFILYRDGFMLLVMGYTGKKALSMKLPYIEAFNRMEAELAARQQTALSAAPAPAATPATYTPPVDMSTGRADALRRIESAIRTINAAQDVVRLFCHPGAKTMRMPPQERALYDAEHQLYAHAIDTLYAARCTLEAGHALERLRSPKPGRSLPAGRM